MALAGVIGWPISHSKSPRLHGFWLAELKVAGYYIPLPVAPADFPDAVRMLPKLGFAGANVTIPHKEAAFAVCDSVDPLAQRIGAVNTLVFRDGTIHGTNTDGYGFLANLQDLAPAWRPEAGPAVLLGAGGAARAAAVALIDAGVPKVTLVNRTFERAAAIAASLGPAVEAAGSDQVPGLLATAALVVNTTSLGMVGQPALEIDLSACAATTVIADLVYAPPETPLLAAAKARGLVAVDGIGMLLHQAVPGFEAWFGVRPTVTAPLRTHVLGV